MMNQITRDQVPIEETWDLTPIFKDDAMWERSYDELEKEVDVLLQKNVVLSSASDVLEALETFDQLLVNLGKVNSYAMYKYTEDSTNSQNQMMMGRAQLLHEKANQVKTNYVNAFIQVPQEKMEQFKNEEKELHTFDRFLERIEKTRQHSLPSDMEDVLTSLGHTLQTPSNLYQTVTASDMTFDPVRNKDGKEVPISLFMYMTQVETSPDTVLRRNAYESLSKGLEKYQHSLASTLSAEIQKNVSLAKLRGFSSAIDMHLQYASPANASFDSDNISSKFFEEILDTFKKELSPHMQRYARLRKRQLGLDHLSFADVKAPLDPDFDPEISYEEAGEIITEAVGVLGTEYKELMSRVFSERWVYRADNVGRRMIAFGGGVHGVHGYSFYPWGGNLFDVLLLGHELGHAIHFTLAHKNQRLINNSMALFFVESPSTLIEHLIVDYLRKTRDDTRLHRWLNMYLMMSYHHNCVTHVLEAELLRRLYKMAEEKQPLTTATISETKGEILSEFWGDTVEIDEGAKLTWMRQPHYYMGLYPYTYSVGISASTVIAERIKKEGVAVGEQWTDVLKQGGTKDGLDLFKMAGLDMSSTKVISEAIANVGRIVDELEESF
ncbi:M3 family metallopeptidase [Bacillus shivajii]|uniref:M3 family metallopeptidase n=1 Tax=Bacillus shivajii TaxID=1983719 RepID=UPI001CFAABCE|nr:M3 family metallopeptidase [Bacillus shivajii]UCZ55105.1 M3 family metallopeptidase [Bacillus shivajii]